MTSKQRAALRSKAMDMDPIFQIGKSGLTPSVSQAIRDALEARELIKISILKSCEEEVRPLAEMISERTGSQLVQVIGRKIVLYKLNPKKEEQRKKKLSLQKKHVIHPVPSSHSGKSFSERKSIQH
jgi:RNA-binding protein